MCERLMWCAGSWDLGTLEDRVRYTNVYFCILFGLLVTGVTKLIFSPSIGTMNSPSLTFRSVIPVNQSVVPIHLRRRMCEGTEQNLLSSTCNVTRIQFSKRQANQQPCRDAAVTCIGMFIYKNMYWVYLMMSSIGIMLVGQYMWSEHSCYPELQIDMAEKFIWGKIFTNFYRGVTYCTYVCLFSPEHNR